MERLTVKWTDRVYDTFDTVDVVDNEYSKANYNKILTKLGEYEDLEEQGRLIKLPVKDDTTVHRECVHTKSTCYHEDYKCSECPLTELFCDEFYKAIDRCYEEAYASGCLAGIELGKYKAEAELKKIERWREWINFLKV